MTCADWVTAYFLVGAVVMVILFRLRAIKRDTFANQVAAIIEKQLDEDKSSTHRFVERGLIPGLALLFGWLVWPAMLFGRLWVAYQKGNDRHMLQGFSIQDRLSAQTRASESPGKAVNDLFISPHERIILAKERVTRFSAAAIEKANMIDDPQNAVPALPFGHLNPVWMHLKVQQTPGSKFWGFRSERVGNRKEFTAFEGYALFDGETYVDHIVTDYELVESLQ